MQCKYVHVQLFFQYELRYVIIHVCSKHSFGVMLLPMLYLRYSLGPIPRLYAKSLYKS